MEAIPSQRTMRTFARGEEVGPYRILAPLGLGASGSVYLARRSDVEDVHRRPVALKLLSVAHQPHADPYTTFRNEARVGQMLHHQNVVQLYDFGKLPGLRSLYLEIEWVRGCDLDRLLHQLRKTSGRLPTAVACRISADIALGLAYAHDCYDSESGTRMCVVHRDLKPGNVLVERSGVSKITDLGIAHGSLWSEDEEERVEGTPPYMAPEQWDPGTGKAITRAADLFSLGCILYELCTTKRFADQLPGRTTATLLLEDVERIVLHQKGIPEDLGALMRDMLHPDAGARMDDAGIVALRLAHHAATHSEVAEHLGKLGIWDSLDRIDQVVREDAAAHPQVDSSTPDATLSERYDGASSLSAAADQAGASVPSLAPATLAGNGVARHAAAIPERAPGRRSARRWATVAGVVFAALAVAALGWWTMRASVTIVGAPEGTVVRVDGEAPRPLDGTGVRYTLWHGHRFRFECGGYVPFEVQLPAFSTFLDDRLELAMVRSAALVVDILPGSLVWVDGQLRGKSPLTVDGLPSGQALSVLVVNEAGSSRSFVVTLKPGEERRLGKHDDPH